MRMNEVVHYAAMDKEAVQERLTNDPDLMVTYHGTRFHNGIAICMQGFKGGHSTEEERAIVEEAYGEPSPLVWLVGTMDR